MNGRPWRGPRHFHIVMSRILSPGYRLILCANKPFRPGVKLSVTPERSPTRFSLPTCTTSSLPLLIRTAGHVAKGRRPRRSGCASVCGKGRERALMVANWPEKRPGRESDRPGNGGEKKKSSRQLIRRYHFLFTVAQQKRR